MPDITTQRAQEILISVVTNMTSAQKANLKLNLDSGKTINCGLRAYIFSDENGGCLLSLAVSTDRPRHIFDFERIRPIDEAAKLLYKEMMSKFSLDYYRATQLLTEEQIREIAYKAC